MIPRICFLVLIAPLALHLTADLASAGDAKKALDIRAGNGTVLISADQIIAYDWATHTLALRPGVRKTLFTNLKDGLAKGQPFMVAVDGKTIYEGTFTSLASSSSFVTAVIVLDEAAYVPMELNDNQVRIGLGYPGKNSFKGEDPRGDPRIEASLKANNKLKLSPEDYLKVLKKRFKDGPSYAPGLDGPAVAAIKEQDIPELIKLLDSKEKCAATMQLGSAVYPADGSTIGHEAAVLIDSFRIGKLYPVANTSTKHSVDREALLQWWKDREKKNK